MGKTQQVSRGTRSQRGGQTVQPKRQGAGEKSQVREGRSGQGESKEKAEVFGTQGGTEPLVEKAGSERVEPFPQPIASGNGTPPLHSHLDLIRSLIPPREHTMSTPGRGLIDGQAKSVVHTMDGHDEIHILEIADVQFGHIGCKVDKLIEYRDWILSKPNRYCVWVGDMVDAWRVGSPGAGYDNLWRPDSQLRRFAEVVAPLVPRTLGSVGGNHERRALAGGVDLGSLISMYLGVPYSEGAQLGFINFGKWQGDNAFKFHLWHGRGAARTTGAQVNMAMSVIHNCDAHVFFSGHIHNAFVIPINRHRTRNGWVESQKGYVVSCTSFLEHWGSYSETAGYADKGLLMPLVIVKRDGTFRVEI